MSNGLCAVLLAESDPIGDMFSGQTKSFVGALVVVGLLVLIFSVLIRVWDLVSWPIRWLYRRLTGQAPRSVESEQAADPPIRQVRTPKPDAKPKVWKPRVFTCRNPRCGRQFEEPPGGFPRCAHCGAPYRG